MPRLALATAIAAAGQDDDLLPLLDACERAGLDTVVRAWDDPSVGWSRFDAVVLRSTWDYTQRLPEFLRWCEHVEARSRLINPLPVVRWNADKHYLADLAALGVPIVPTCFVEPEHDPLPALHDFFGAHPHASEFVVKPAVGAGSRDAQRYARSQEFAAANHIARLLDAGSSAMLQPYLSTVDDKGETALIHMAGASSHAIRKGPLLAAEAEASSHLFLVEAITPRIPEADELEIARRTLDAMRQRLGLSAELAYARVDLIRNDAGEPLLLELELCEPSLFLDHAAGSADRFAKLLADTIERRVA